MESGPVQHESWCQPFRGASTATRRNVVSGRQIGGDLLREAKCQLEQHLGVRTRAGPARGPCGTLVCMRAFQFQKTVALERI